MTGATGVGSPRQRPRRHLLVVADLLEGTVDDQTAEVVLPLDDTGLMNVLDDVQVQLDRLLESGPHALIVDMSRVGQISSTTIAAILWVKRRCLARGVQVSLRGPAQRDVETLKRIGLLDALRLAP